MNDTVKITVNTIWSRLDGPDLVKESLSDKMTVLKVYKYVDKKKKDEDKKQKRTIKEFTHPMYFFNKKTGVFLTGFLETVTEYLQEKKFKFEIEDKRKKDA